MNNSRVFGPSLSVAQHVDRTIVFSHEDVLAILFEKAIQQMPSNKWYSGHTSFRCDSGTGRISATISLWEVDPSDEAEQAK